MQGFSYFPAIVYRDEQPDFIHQVLPTCIDYLNRIRDSNKSFYQSQHLEKEFSFKNISNYILNSSLEILRNQGYAVDYYDFYFSGLWAQEIHRGSGTSPHVHKNSQICGWFFLETPQFGSYPIYYDTRANKNMIELDFVQKQEILFATNAIHFNNILPGTVMFANSWMQHQLTTNNSDLPTRCIHFIISHRDRL